MTKNGAGKRHVAVIFVHGIFAQDINFAAKMAKRLQNRLARFDLHHYVHFRSVFWAGTVRDHQREFLGRASAKGEIGYIRLRRYVIEGLGDAAAYQKTKHRDGSIYYQVQDAIGAKIDSLDLPDLDNCPLIFIGHSLGCHIISSFLWDLNKLKQRSAAEIESEPDPEVRKRWEQLQNAGAFRRMETCAGIVTLGSNIPVFTFTFGPNAVYPITNSPKDASGGQLTPAFPGSALPKELQERARWLNFYNKWDILGFPLRSLNDDYRQAEKIHDICLWSQRPWFLPYSWFIFAHSCYWKNRMVLGETTKLVREMIEEPKLAAATHSIHKHHTALQSEHGKQPKAKWARWLPGANRAA
jgi:hypothetical protein